MVHDGTRMISRHFTKWRVDISKEPCTLEWIAGFSRRGAGGRRRQCRMYSIWGGDEAARVFAFEPEAQTAMLDRNILTNRLQDRIKA